MNTPLLQTEKWQNFQQDLKKTTFFEKTDAYQFLATLEKTPLGNYLYLPYGPVASNQSNFKKALVKLQEIAKENQAIFIRIEPQNKSLESYLAKNFKKTKDLNPKETWTLDLTQDQSEIIKNFSQGTRTRYNQFKNKGLTVEVSKDLKDIKYLAKLQSKLAKEKKFIAFEEDYLKTELEQDFASLYLVKYKGEVIVASLFFDDQSTRYYMQSAADSEYKKLPGTVALLTTALFDAKEKGLKNFDFWGIAPENAPKDHPWLGFTEFKKSFGGQMVEYCGTYDYILNKPKYSLYQIFRKTNRLIRKIKSNA